MVPCDLAAHFLQPISEVAVAKFCFLLRGKQHGRLVSALR